MTDPLLHDIKPDNNSGAEIRHLASFEEASGFEIFVPDVKS